MPKPERRTSRSPHRLPRLLTRPGSKDNKMATQSMFLPTRPPLSPTDDGEEDVCAPRKDMPANLNQSIFQFFTQARTGSAGLGQLDEDDESGDDDGDIADKSTESIDRRTHSLHGIGSPRQVPKLVPIEEKALQDDDEDADLGPAPFMSQILEARAEADSVDLNNKVPAQVDRRLSEAERAAAKSEDLQKKLMEIFMLPEMEEVVSEYQCWLLKSVLLQGYLYVTKNHVCFYAYLPKKTETATKTGYLDKRGKSTVKFTRYWFVLQGNVFSYFSDPQEHYFPNGQIDLRYGISAKLVESKDGSSTCFTVHTDQRHYYFRAGSVTSAKEWVKALQKVILRNHNEGDSVKISIPLSSIMEVEESPVLEFADTLKLKVLDNESFAIDEYFFSFFSLGTDALHTIQSAVEDFAARQLPSGPPTATSVEYLGDNVRTTLSTGTSARTSPRPSGEYSRSSCDIPRRSADISRDKLKIRTTPSRHSSDLSRASDSVERMGSPTGHRRDASAGSFRTDTSFGEPSGDDESQSASQILSRSDVFRSPTIKQKIRRSISSRRRKDEDQSEPSSPNPTIRAQPPTRRHTADSRRGSMDDEQDATFRPSDPSLQDIAKTGKYPLQRAAYWSDWMKKAPTTFGKAITQKPMTVFEKVTGMWAGGKHHYRQHESGEPSEPDGKSEPIEVLEERFRNYFALSHTEQLTASYFGYLNRVLPLYGKMYLGTSHCCFRSMMPGTKTKMVLPLKDIENVTKEKGFRFGYFALVITIRGHEEIFFEFRSQDVRDDCVSQIYRAIDRARHLSDNMPTHKLEKEEAEAARKEHELLQGARFYDKEHGLDLPTNFDSHINDGPPIVFDDTHGSILNFKPTESMNVTCLTIGSRGDVQPFIALCLGLMKDGHKCKIATHGEFKNWIEGFGIEFAEVGGDPAELMAMCVEYGMFTFEFMKQTTSRMRGWLDELLKSAWLACQGSDLLIESPAAMAGIHIAEALQIPYFRAFTMPWTRTRSYPHAFAVPEHKMGGAYNYLTYVIIDNVFWKATASQINRWRTKMLGLTRTNLDKLQIDKVPFLYNFSPSVVIPPLDFSDWIRVTGYWFLDVNSDWTPPKDLQDFIETARKDEKKIVYVGFGSVTVADPSAMTRTVVEAVQEADVRCILSKGWSDRMATKDSSEPEVPLPKEIFQISSCPHDWLFNQVDAAVHHGGAGTTGASLRAGIPTVIKPFFGDQYFFANRVEDLGVGLCIRKMNTERFSKALKMATSDPKMVLKAKILGESIRNEDGVYTAVNAIYRDLEYAKTLIKKHPHNGQPAATATAAGDQGKMIGIPDDVSEESWTVVDEDDNSGMEKSIASLRGLDRGKTVTSTPGSGVQV